eukprot:1316567-Prymnesium_polylepis.1
MEALLKSGSSTAGGFSAGDTSSAPSGAEDKDPVMWGRMFAQQQSQALFLLLDQPNPFTGHETNSRGRAMVADGA